MGRRTYDGFAPVWRARSGDPYSDRINSLLFRECPLTKLELVDARPLETGIVILSYALQ
jgi:dihydrofolate reductase